MGTRRAVKPPGGETSHNLFSWNDGSIMDSQTANSANAFANGLDQNNGNVMTGRPSIRTHPAAISSSQITFSDSGFEPILRRPGSERKQSELSGSGIFCNEPIHVSSNAYANNNDQNNGNFITDRPSVRVHKPAGGASQITFGSDEPVPVKKIVSTKKLMELSDSVETLDDIRSKRMSSEAKFKELNGSISLFSPPPVPLPMDSSQSKNHGQSSIIFGEAPVDEAPRRVSEQKIADLAGRGVFMDESPSLSVSDAKIRELKGCNIFSDEQPVVRDSVRGTRRPPGGISSITFS